MTSATSNTQDDSQLLLQLLLGSGLVTRNDYDDYKMIAKDLKIPIVQAIANSGIINQKSMDLANEALRQVKGQKITPDTAIRALRVSMQKDIKFDAAVKSVKDLHQQTSVVVAVSNELSDLIIAAGLLTRQQLGPLLVKSQEFSVMIGQLLVLEDLISTDVLLAALHAVLMLRESGLQKEAAVNGLSHASKHGTSIEQSLFELGTFIHPDAKTTRIGELCLMSGIISKEILAECLEIELFKKKQFGQILLERGLMTTEQLEAAIQLQSSISNNSLKPYQAASALHAVCKQGKNVYAAMAEFRTAADTDANIRLGDLIVEAGILDKEKVEANVTKSHDSAVRVGSSLLKAGLIDESTLYSALRLQTSLRLGYISRDQTIDLLHYCFEHNANVEKSLSENQTYVPARMQWTWV